MMFLSKFCNSFTQLKCMKYSLSSSLSTARVSAPRVRVVAPKKYQENSKLFIAEACKTNLHQSPLKMKFLVKLINRSWVPDALAQLKFSPKHRAVDVEKVLRRACSMAKIYFNAIPEELMVKEVMINKGIAMKKIRIMGRGRTGVGYTRKSHITIKVQKIDFEAMISKSKTPGLSLTWKKRGEMVDKIKEEQAAALSNMTLEAS
jgi:large subunit ribosomal protein L22